jgi:hypothetical protein
VLEEIFKCKFKSRCPSWVKNSFANICEISWFNTLTHLITRFCDYIILITVFFYEQLRGYLNEILLDQIPNLVDLQRYLEHLAVVDPPIAKKDLVLEQVSGKKCL